MTKDVREQLRRLPADASYLVISTGGNDAVNHLNLLSQSTASVSQVLDIFWEVGLRFRDTYHLLLANVLSLRLPTPACTIYCPAFEDLALRRAASAGLAFFNEAILLEAAQRRVPVLDLRIIFTRPEDYANPIEPSEIGGTKLADVICRLILKRDSNIPYSRVYF